RHHAADIDRDRRSSHSGSGESGHGISFCQRRAVNAKRHQASPGATSHRTTGAAKQLSGSPAAASLGCMSVELVAWKGSNAKLAVAFCVFEYAEDLRRI